MTKLSVEIAVKADSKTKLSVEIAVRADSKTKQCRDSSQGGQQDKT